MKLSAAAVRQAIAQHLDEGLASALKLPSNVEDSDVGALLGVTLGVAAETSLSRAVISTSQGDVATLSPAELIAHPLLGRWLRPTLYETLGAAFTTGSRVTYVDPTSPTFGLFDVLDIGDGQTVATVQLSFPGGAEAVVQFGNVEAKPFIRGWRMNGDALVLAGRDARAWSGPLDDAARSITIN